MRKKASGAADDEARWWWWGPSDDSAAGGSLDGIALCPSPAFLRFCPLPPALPPRPRPALCVRVAFVFLLWRWHLLPALLPLARSPLVRSPGTLHMWAAEMAMRLIVSHLALSLYAGLGAAPLVNGTLTPSPHCAVVGRCEAAERRSDGNGRGRRERRWETLPRIETTRTRTCLSVNLRVRVYKPRRCPAQPDRQRERTWSCMRVALSSVSLWLRVSLPGRCCGLRVCLSLSCFR